MIHEGRDVCESLAGVATIGDDETVDRRDSFYIASLAKPLTAAAILRLVTEEKLSLHDSVRSHIPELPSPYERVTIRHLLRHESGTPDHFDHLPAERIEGLTNDDVLGFLRDQTLEFEPGSGWSYSNSGYVLLAEIVERVTGNPFESWIEVNIFERFEMSDASIGTSPGDMVRAYEAIENEKWRQTEVGPRTVGPGGVYASLADLENWFLAVRRGEAISPEYLVQAIAPTLTAGGKLTPFSIAFQVEDITRSLYYAGSFGDLGGYRHTLVWLTDSDLAVILLCARGDIERTPLLDALRASR